MSELGLIRPVMPTLRITTTCGARACADWRDVRYSHPSCRATMAGHHRLIISVAARHALYAYKGHEWVVRCVTQRRAPHRWIEDDNNLTCFLRPGEHLSRYIIGIERHSVAEVGRKVQGLWVTLRFAPNAHNHHPRPERRLLYAMERELRPLR